MYREQYIVKDFMANGRLEIPQQLAEILSDCNVTIDVDITCFDSQDELIWEGAQDGRLTVKRAYEYYREKEQSMLWVKFFWQTFIPPRVSMLAWKIYHDRIPTDENMNAKGITVEGGCYLCGNTTVLENQNHLFWSCPMVQEVWSWVATCMVMIFIHRCTDIKQTLQWACDRNKKDQRNQCIISITMTVIWCVWRMRNAAVFDNLSQDIRACIRKIKSMMSNLMIIRTFGVKPNFRNNSLLKEVYWYKPQPGWHKINTDGAARGNPVYLLVAEW